LPYLNLAVAAGVAYLVTATKTCSTSWRTRRSGRKFPQLRVVDPVGFLNAVRAADGS